MGEIPIKEENKNLPNEEAKIIIEKCKEALRDFLPPNGIDKYEGEILNSFNNLSEKAKIIIHKWNRGATIISSTGSITKIGSSFYHQGDEGFLPDVDYDKKHKKTETEFNYALQEMENILESGKIVDNNQRENIKKLDEILENVVIVLTDDNAGAIIADNEGKVSFLKKSTPINNFNKINSCSR